ncbi:MAG TPA: DUF397 domain-containing protein [Candidatus Limnocylindrales bacterium]|nr:DUF397 domain-containing protein [Candidatus Limnocylindrales bacterium]
MSETSAIEPLRWIKSTRSTSNGNCVEVAGTVTGIAVRDSKDPDGPVLRFSAEAWQGFIDGVRTGTFDLPQDR